MAIFKTLSEKLHLRSKSPKTTTEQSSSSKPATTTTTPSAKMSVVLILGAGPRIGAAVTEAYLAAGWKVAVASRKGTNSKADNGVLSVQADFAQPSSIAGVFDAVKSGFGAAPSIIIYNAAALTPPSDKDSALSIPAEKVSNDLNVNTVSPFVAAQQAIAGWETLGADAKKLFIYTGNIMNVTVVPVPMMLNLGVGKAASAYWLGVADATYGAKGYRFIYADERHEDGKFKGMALDGPAHGEFYSQLAKSTDGVPWHATFVKGKGYTKF